MKSSGLKADESLRQNYQDALSAKILYLKDIYNSLNENTVMIVTSDSGKIVYYSF